MSLAWSQGGPLGCKLKYQICPGPFHPLTFKFSRRAQREGGEVQASYPPYTKEHIHGRTAEDVVRSRDNGDPPSPRDRCGHSHTDQPAHEPKDATEPIRRGSSAQVAPRREQQAASIASAQSPVTTSKPPARIPMMRGMVIPVSSQKLLV